MPLPLPPAGLGCPAKLPPCPPAGFGAFPWGLGPAAAGPWGLPPATPAGAPGYPWLDGPPGYELPLLPADGLLPPPPPPPPPLPPAPAVSGTA